MGDPQKGSPKFEWEILSHLCFQASRFGVCGSLGLKLRLGLRSEVDRVCRVSSSARSFD